jgi:hypothetical protein
LKVKVPILRDTEQTARAFRFAGIPTMFIIGADGVVQDCETGLRPKLAEELPEKLGKLLAGENIYEKPLKDYEEELLKYGKMLEASAQGDSTTTEQPSDERKVPEVKTADRTEPTHIKLTPLWKCSDLKAPGNILILSRKGGPTRLAVVEGWKSIAEIGLDGKLIAMHTLKLAENENVGNLRAATGADGKRYLVAFVIGQQRCHVLDESWNLLASYPENALTNPHTGIVDVELGDLDGDGKLKMYLSYFGVVGVQGASLDGKRLWSNRSVSNVFGLAVSPPDAKGRRDLICADASGPLVLLDAAGQRRSEIAVGARKLGWLMGADLRGDGQTLWCGMVAPKQGDNLAVGFSLRGEELWNYPLPSGVQPQPIEPIIPGRVTRQGPGQWILPSPDGSIHIIAADGKPLDKFNSGVMLQGLSTIEVDGQPALVISSSKGLEAWKIE